MDDLIRWLEGNGFLRTATVREPGEYAVRGGILDLFAAGAPEPVRLDFFGDTLEIDPHLRSRDQRTTGQRRRASSWCRSSEMALTPDSDRPLPRALRRRCSAPPTATTCSTTRSARAAATSAWSTGCRCSPTSWRRCSIIVGDAPVVLDHLADEAVAERLDQIADHYEARRAALEAGDAGGGAPYKPLPPDRLYLDTHDWMDRLDGARRARVCRRSRTPRRADVVDIGGRAGRSFAAERSAERRQRLRRGHRPRRRR